jgi:hypothetical protein
LPPGAFRPAQAEEPPVPYAAPISRTNPTAFVFPLVQSSSMREPFAGQPQKSKAAGISDALNGLLQNLVLKCAKADGIRDFFHVGLLSYGGRVASAFGGALAGKGLVPVSEIAAHPLRVELRARKVSDGAGGLAEEQVKFPVWFEARPAGRTPMSAALRQAAVGGLPGSPPGALPGSADADAPTPFRSGTGPFGREGGGLSRPATEPALDQGLVPPPARPPTRYTNAADAQAMAGQAGRLTPDPPSGGAKGRGRPPTRRLAHGACPPACPGITTE